MRALAFRHERLADLALSFPTLLFALAAPRRGLDAARAIALVVDGARLADVAQAADVPLWLRKLPPEAMTRRLAPLPDDKTFRRKIVNHLPTKKLAPAWLEAVSDAADIADGAFAIWVAKEIVRDLKGVEPKRLRRVGLWAWFSRQPETFGHSLIDKCWTPDMQFPSAQDAAYDWYTTVALHANLGREPVSELWLRPALVGGHTFRPLACALEIEEEARAMDNCLRTYGENVVHDGLRLWSLRKDGERVATLSVAFRHGDPIPDVSELQGPRNEPVPYEVWRTVRQWILTHDFSGFTPKARRWGGVPLDQPTWRALWRPYWLAKRRLPEWLPLAPSRRALDRL
ncbi:MAG TPA: hypothetical protein VMI56_12740 [Reyranella sp.]|nr:hypothetical protein [Reyranella sp.]